jgi:hypothetical protein
MLKQFQNIFSSLLLATQALLGRGKSKKVSDKWMTKQLHKYESADRKSGGLW